MTIGSGGVMLPNHAPLIIAEQFGTLAALFPDCIELGLGRVPGTDQPTMAALRRTLSGSSDAFPRDVLELQHDFKHPEPGQSIQAVPGGGLPYAFASHFAPGMLDQAVKVYRERFEPSEQLDEPYVMCGMNVVCADSDDEAQFLRTSTMQSFINLSRCMPDKLPPPVRDCADRLMPAERMGLENTLSCSAAGTQETVAREIDASSPALAPTRLW